MAATTASESAAPRSSSKGPAPETTAAQLEGGSPPGALEGDFKTVQRSFGFWAIIVGLGITLWLAALENSVLTTAAPVMLREIPLGDNWIWLTNAFFLASAAFQPLMGQLANLFGRRWLALGVIAIFMLGSGICGGANNEATLIAGRAVQGIGSGGILMSYDVIVSDLVPLRYRGNYIAIILLIYSIGTTTGALIGGVIVDNITWRWIFWINLPIGALSLAIIFFFLHVHHNSTNKTPWHTRLFRQIDWTGNAILIAGSVSMLTALTYAGTRHPWSSWQTLLPLFLGFASFPALWVFETSRFVAPADPVVPARLFATRTSVIVGVNTFLFTAVVYWAVFFLPVYFQAVQLLSPTRAGINVIPVSLLGVPAAAAAAAAVSRWGRYKAIHLIGFTLFTLGLGLFSRLGEDSPTWEWAVYMVIGGVGGGFLLNTQLPAFQAGVGEEDQAAATGTWNFLRTLGSIWGVAIPAAVFGNRVDNLIAGGAVRNVLAAGAMVGGGAYQYASAEFVRFFPDERDQEEIRAVYRLAVQRVFVVGVAFAGFAWALCWWERDVPLRTELVTEYGLKEKEGGESSGGEREQVMAH
ncbi:major facilitator superfamily domain-containing protein [Triangularia verruculosa]|uniref:Major facilitator superfamily domain-containing protein n=1 Tax=Triangularia verruculosa TaxID=2587418 RepID=A0AAN6X9R5_9PEZI|nr:major facilitator superfamily domain-containing protein [Triangularia verruculosa]